MKESKRKRYADSIMPHLYTPYGDMVRHEVFCANTEEEALSRAYGLWIWVTPQRDNILRDAPDCISNVMYREDAQRAFEALYGRDEFIRLFGRSYLTEYYYDPAHACGAEKMWEIINSQ